MATLSVPESLGRWSGFALFTGMLGFQIHLGFQLEDSWISHLRWILITLLFVLFWSAYLVRRPLKAQAVGWKDWLLPLCCAALPFAIMMLPNSAYAILTHYDPRWSEVWIWPVLKNLRGEPITLGLWTMAIGEMLTIWGMLSLRGNFSIATEVRDWVKTGPYRWVRHPLYAGEILSVWGYACFWPSIWTLVGAISFHFLQFLRARHEEQKLISVYPDYIQIQNHCGMFIPKSFKRRNFKL